MSAVQQARLLQDVLGRAAAEPYPIAGLIAEVASVRQTSWSSLRAPTSLFPGTRGERPENFEEAQHRGTSR
jgi:hypothetical protein